MARLRGWKRAIEAGTNWSAAEARAALEAQSKSGESVVAFARRHGIVAERLYWWRNRLAVLAKRTRKTDTGTVGRLIPLTVVEPPAMAQSAAASGVGGRVVVIDGGLRVEVEDAGAVSPAWIATLLRTVKEGA